MPLEKDTFSYHDMNVKSVGKGFYFHFRKGILSRAPKHYLENIKIIAPIRAGRVQDPKFDKRETF